MAHVFVHASKREITDPAEICEFLKPYGIWYEKWDVDGRITEEATNEEVLEAYAPEIDRLKEKGGFVTADIISVNPETPGLDAMLDKFNKEHTHSEDEVRFTIKGQGVFHIHADDGAVFGIHVESGDLINVPEGIKHWFDLCDDKTIRCIRMFEDASGWAPHYVDEPVHEGFAPMCFGPDYLPPAGDIDPVVKV